MPLGGRRLRAAALLVGFVAAIAGITVWTSSARTAPAPAKRPTVAAVATPKPAPPKPAPRPEGFGAVAIPAKVAVYDTQGATTPRQSLSNPTWERMPLAFFVEERQGDWLKVRLNVRPNGNRGWIKASDVTLNNVPYLIRIDTANHVLRLLRNDETVLFEAPVGVGKAVTPTPKGSFYLDAIVKTKNSAGVYGPYQLSVGGFSEVLKSFGGGPGQIAIHGTNRPQLIPGDISNGCIRMENANIIRLAQLVNVGTPVEIV